MIVTSEGTIKAVSAGYAVFLSKKDDFSNDRKKMEGMNAWQGTLPDLKTYREFQTEKWNASWNGKPWGIVTKDRNSSGRVCQSFFPSGRQEIDENMAIKAPLHVKPSMYRPGQTLDFHNIQTTCMVKSGFKALIKVCPRSFFWGGKKIPKNKSNPRFRITTEQYFSILTGTHVGSLGTSG